MWTKIKDSVAENIILVSWMLVTLAFIVATGRAGDWLEVGKYIVGQHLINSGLNSPFGYGMYSRVTGVGGNPAQIKG